MLTQNDVEIQTLGEPRYESTIPPRAQVRGDRLLVDDRLSTLSSAGAGPGELPAFECAGPRNRLFFDPAEARVGIVTCGGLCPGLNDVIRGLVMVLYHRYGARGISGFRYGYAGLNPDCGHEIMPLTPQTVARIHEHGGTILGSSRGPQPTQVMVDELVRRRVNVLFVIGGDGTQRGAIAISQEARLRGVELAVVGIPKTIDNDIEYIDVTFGFQTACTAAHDAIAVAHIEAKAAYNGVGLVQLMGRHSGFIAAASTVANNDVNYVLVPEVRFPMDGPDGLLGTLERRLAASHHAVIVVAEGAGQQYCAGEGTDASGNKRLGEIGAWLSDRLSAHFAQCNTPINVRYINPSYMIRGLPATPVDSIYCYRLAAYAVHAAMSGRTEMIVGRHHGRYVHIPMSLVTTARKQIDPNGNDWQAVLEATGQPAWGEWETNGSPP